MTVRIAEIQERIAILLADISIIEHEDSRITVLNGLRDREYDVPELPRGTTRVVCSYLTREAARQPGMLQQLAHVVSVLDESLNARRFVAEVRKQLPGDFFALEEGLKFVDEVATFIELDELQMYHRQVVGDVSQEELEDAADLIRELADLPAADQCHPLIMLTEQIAVRSKRRGARKAAHGWSDRMAELIDASPRKPSPPERAKLAALRKAQPRKVRTGCDDEQATLMLLLDPYGPRPEVSFLLNAWLFREGMDPVRQYAPHAPFDIGDVRLEVGKQVRRVIRQLTQPGSVAHVQVEFFVPRSLMDEAVEDWVMRDDGVTLGTQCIVVIRDRDRLRDEILWPSWQRKWRRVTTARSRPGVGFSRWITCADAPCPPGELRHRLSGEEFISLGLTFPPGSSRHELGDALTAGTPVAVWPRQRCAHPVPARSTDSCLAASFQENVCRRLAGKKLAEYPRLVWELRKAAGPNGDGPGLALLWDDADRLPPDFQLDAPQ
ncbi:MAG TPA: hypothetical protein VF070_16730 [Streptosporangiaceae bacterium]